MDKQVTALILFAFSIQQQLFTMNDFEKTKIVYQKNWQPHEDAFLRSIVSSKEKVDWTLVEKTFNLQFSKRQKSSKQLRERYINHAKFDRKEKFQGEWTEGETKQLFRLYLVYGPKWTQLTQAFPGKSESNLKNKFYGSIRKLLRKVNSLEKQLLPSCSKPIQYDAFVRVLDIHSSRILVPEEMMPDCESLKNQLIKYCADGLEAEQKEHFIQFCHSLHQFNFKTRCYRSRRKSNKYTSSSNKRELKNQQELTKKCQKNIKKQQSTPVDPVSASLGTQFRLKNQQVYKIQEDNIKYSLKIIGEDQKIFQLNQKDRLEFQACQILGISFISENDCLKILL